jgi:hypothetical protein
VPAALFLNQSGRGGCFGSRFLGVCLFLPFQYIDPVLIFLRVKFGFPSTFAFFAGLSGAVIGVTANTITGGNIVVELPLEFAGNLIAIDESVQNQVALNPWGMKLVGFSWEGSKRAV